MPQHDDEFARIQPVIELAQRLHSSLHGKLMEKGVAPIDAAIASAYATYQLATTVHGSPAAAIEWMRDVINTIERQLLDQANAR
ncbi:hypothetical protein [Sphingomonas endolithica]|uniref:hypothetical protein n=1 Tax=Sphingomonas endolithica TaxID=2972485 RepID=UPI0021AFF7C5|nr:hypothetical protein [Sphingomonas sp. ZFBP2030]